MSLNLVPLGLLLLATGCISTAPSVPLDAASPEARQQVNAHLQERTAVVVHMDGARASGRRLALGADSLQWTAFASGAPRSVALADVRAIETTGFSDPLIMRKRLWVGALGTVALVQVGAVARGVGHGTPSLRDVALTALAGAAGGALVLRLSPNRGDTRRTVGRYVLAPAR